MTRRNRGELSLLPMRKDFRYQVTKEQLTDDHTTYIRKFTRRYHRRAGNHQSELPSQAPAYRLLHARLSELGVEEDPGSGRAARLRGHRAARFAERYGFVQIAAIHRRQVERELEGFGRAGAEDCRPRRFDEHARA